MNTIVRTYVASAIALLGFLTAASIVFQAPLASRVAAQDSNFSTTSVTVGNATPSVTDVTVTPSPIVLTEDATTSVTITATITDQNGCSDVISSGTINFVLYRTGVSGSSSCSFDANACYTGYSTYTVQPSNPCGGGGDTSAAVSTTIPVWYIADPTDSSSTFAAEWWAGYAKAIDFSNASSSATSSAAVDLNTLAALSVTATINYNAGIGNLSPGQNTGVTNQTATTTNTGNSKVDIEFSGTDMTSSALTIAATNQRYGTSSVDYPSLSFQLSGAATVRDINLYDATVTTTPNTSSTFWGITIPTGTTPADYTGTNTFTAAWSN